MNKLHVKTGDTVKILSGKDRGKTGKVMRAIPKKDAVVVEGVNMVKSHERSRKRGQKGQIVEREMPIHVSNVRLADKARGKTQNKRRNTQKVKEQKK